LVAELKKKGIKNAFALLGGLNAWKGVNYPTEGEGLKKP
jgi:rhodanese-related sulfurtransferase